MRRTLLLLGLLALLASATVVLAQSGFSLGRYVIGGGGGHSTGGSYALDSTLAQPVAGVIQGGSYRIEVGYWEPALGTVIYRVWLPLILHNH